jgi:iron-sulfur cluster assembly accessory protein
MHSRRPDKKRSVEWKEEYEEVCMSMETQVAPVDAPTHGVLLSEAAGEKVKSLLDQEGRSDLRLRIAVQPGGCSGLIYQLFFDERYLENDAIVEFNGVEVIVDEMSVPYLDGSTIDFADTIEKQGFTIDNPNAQGSCACGDSFS